MRNPKRHGDKSTKYETLPSQKLNYQQPLTHKTHPKKLQPSHRAKQQTATDVQTVGPPAGPLVSQTPNTRRNRLRQALKSALIRGSLLPLREAALRDQPSHEK